MNSIETLTQILRESKNVVFFGGAGMSTESGVPDFRSANGIYSQRLHQEFRPAAGLIDYFRGRHLVLINKTETKADSRAELVIRDAIGKVLSAAVAGI